jgi:adenosyl cobinamide kinase/adenosyl cobinamide phosphate guanylyltransferase
MPYTYISGGASSGKSRYAIERIADGEVTFIATGVETDEEMAVRIEQHKASRPPDWITIEEPVDLIRAVRTSKTNMLIIDCITFWVANLIYRERLHNEDINRKAHAVASFLAETDREITVVTNELGMGLIPEHNESRSYRKIAGEVNQIFARHAKDAYFVVSGIPIRIK